MTDIKKEQHFSMIIIKLMKAVIYGDDDPVTWQYLLELQSSIRDYVRVLGLDLFIMEDEGIAWLANKALEDGEVELPRLVNKRQLSFPVSLVLVLLRRKLVEHDASSGESRLILDKDDIIEQLRIFIPTGSNEARWMDQVETYINKVVELGFIRRLQNHPDKIEVCRIIKAFVDAQWLSHFDERLQKYAAHAEIYFHKEGS